MTAVVVTSGQKKDGTYWARFDAGTHYAVGEGATSYDAILSAVFEAQGIPEQDEHKIDYVNGTCSCGRTTDLAGSASEASEAVTDVKPSIPDRNTKTVSTKISSESSQDGS